jgi:hypothetical protein
VSTSFFSSEYPEWVCSPYNDFFVVLLDSSFDGSPPNPTDGNLAIWEASDSSRYPVGVNLAFADAGLFSQCLNGPTGCTHDAVDGTVTSCTGTTGLTGTGMDVVNPLSAIPGEEATCGVSNLAGGGTGWLRVAGNVVPGETMELRFALWDTGDGLYDSVVLIDNFAWSVDPVTPGASSE